MLWQWTIFLLCRHLILEQPATVLYYLTTAPVQKPKEMELKVVESVTSPSVSLANVNQPVSQPMLPAGDQEKGPTEACTIAGSSEGQLKQQSPPPPSTSDVASELCDESEANSESLQVREPLPVSGNNPDEETRDQQTKPEWHVTTLYSYEFEKLLYYQPLHHCFI